MTWRAAEAVARAAQVCRRLTLTARHGVGDRVGDRRVPGRPQPSGMEVEAFRPYSPGDDVRHIDWNAAARTDALVTRRFTAERAVRFDVLIDASASMDAPAGDGKLDAVRELATALAWMGLAAGDAVALHALGRASGPVCRHRASAARAADWLATLGVAGELDLGTALATHARRHPGPAVSFVVSDLMVEPAAIEAGVHALRRARHAVALLHVLGPSDLDPMRHLTAGVLQDVETGATHPIALTPTTCARYATLLAEHAKALAGVAARAGAAYVRVATDDSLATVLVERLASAGIVRRR